jgi:hypothetical protein
MPFIGNKPSAVPLTSADIADNIITSAKIVDATIANADIANSTINLTTKVTGTLPVANGGTGLATLGTAGQALIVNSGATALQYGSAGASVEYGTWTPTITVTDGGTFNSASDLEANYVKIGQLVYISIETGSISTGGSPAVYASYSFTLPFTCAEVSTGLGIEYGQTGIAHHAYSGENGTVVLLRNWNGNFIANGYLRLGFTYKSTT